MKKDYIAPDLDVIRFRLTSDILGDSKLEDSGDPIYNEPGDDLDPFD